MKQVVHNKPKIKSSTRTITTSDACKSISPSSRSRRVVNNSFNKYQYGGALDYKSSFCESLTSRQEKSSSPNQGCARDYPVLALTRFRKIFLGLVPHSQNNVCKSKAPQNNNNNNNKSKLVKTSLASNLKNSLGGGLSGTLTGAYGIAALAGITTTSIIASTLVNITSTSAIGSSVHFEIVADDVLNMTIPNSTILNIVPTPTGQFENTELPITIETNNSDGYTLTMSAQNTLLYRNTALSNGTVPTIASIDNNNNNGYTEEDFKSTSNTNTLNKWGYKIGTNNYFPVTTTSTKIAESTTNTNSDTTTLTFASKLDNTLPSGTYGTTLVFIATANVATSTCSATNVCYNSNGADGTTTMANEMITYNSENSTYSQSMLYASNFSNTDNGFIGWNTKPDGSGDYYGPHQILTTEELAGVVSSGLQLYAQWMPVERDSSGNAVTMQDWMTDNGCSRLGVGTITALKDARDNNVYAVTKYGDDKCWMMENLRLSSETLTAENTNNPSLPLTMSDGTTTANNLPATSASWCSWSDSTSMADRALCADKAYLNTSATTSTIATMTGNEQNIYSYGNYYNWYSSTAGWGKYNDYTVEINGEIVNINSGTGNTDMPGSICPADWHLPNGGSAAKNNSSNVKSDFWQLGLTIMNGAAPNNGGDGTASNNYYYDSTTGATNAFRSWPYNFLISGYWYDGQAYYRGSRGYFWSSTANSVDNAYDLYLSTFSVNPGTDYSNKYHGFTVRCVSGS